MPRDSDVYERHIKKSSIEEHRRRGVDQDLGMYETEPQTRLYYRDHEVAPPNTGHNRRVAFDDTRHANQPHRSLDKMYDASIINLLENEANNGMFKNSFRGILKNSPTNGGQPQFFPQGKVTAGAGAAVSIPVMGNDGIVRKQAYVPVEAAVKNTPVTMIPGPVATAPVNAPVVAPINQGFVQENIIPLGPQRAMVANPYGAVHPLPATPNIPERGVPQRVPQPIPAPTPTPVPNLYNYQYPTDLKSPHSKAHGSGSHSVHGRHNDNGRHDPDNYTYLQRTIP